MSKMLNYYNNKHVAHKNHFHDSNTCSSHYSVKRFQQDAQQFTEKVKQHMQNASSSYSSVYFMTTTIGVLYQTTLLIMALVEMSQKVTTDVKTWLILTSVGCGYAFLFWVASFFYHRLTVNIQDPEKDPVDVYVSQMVFVLAKSLIELVLIGNYYGYYSKDKLDLFASRYDTVPSLGLDGRMIIQWSSIMTFISVTGTVLLYMHVMYMFKHRTQL